MSIERKNLGLLILLKSLSPELSKSAFKTHFGSVVEILQGFENHGLNLFAYLVFESGPDTPDVP